MSPKLRLTRIVMLAAVSSIAVAVPVAVVSSAATAKSSTKRATKKSKTVTRSCSPPKKYPGSGYFTGKIKATRVSCSYARKFVVRYYKCRTSNGRKPSGKCTKRLSRFKCTEKRMSIPTEIDARVTCRRGNSKIVHTYQQNLE